MSYGDFDLKKVKQQLGVNLIEQPALFSAIEAVEISPILTAVLAENVPLARLINTEKARSEMIIANILIELRKLLKHKISLFSGIEFNVDKSKGLNGFCDFIIGASPQQLMLNRPVIAVVEAKNDNIMSGLGQCIAEMVAAKIFNDNEGELVVNTVYGVVTTGTIWKFLKMDNLDISIDLDEYVIEDTGNIMAVLLSMVDQNLDVAG